MQGDERDPKDQIAPEDIAAPTGPDDTSVPLRTTAPKLARYSQASKIAFAVLLVVAVALVAYGFHIFDGPKSIAPVANVEAPPLSTKDRSGATGDASSIDQMTDNAPKALPPINVDQTKTAKSKNSSANDTIGQQLNSAASQNSSVTTPAPTATFDTSAPNIPPADGANNSGGVPNPGGSTPYSQQQTAPSGQSAVSATDAAAAHRSAILVADTGTQTPAPSSSASAETTTQRTADSPPVDQTGSFSGPTAPTVNGGTASTTSSDSNGEGMGSNSAVATRVRFANGQNERPAYLTNTVADPIGKFELWRGSAIKAQLDSGINTDLPGPVLAHVTEDVFDSKTGQTLVIPKASRLHGRYNAYVADGQTRVEVNWDYLTWPDGKWISLDGMAGAEPDGNAGLRADVNDHRGALIGAALFTAVLSAGANIISGNQQTGTTEISNGQVISQSVGSQLAETGKTYIDKKGDIPPENTVPKGKPFIVETDRTIVLPPYVYDQRVSATSQINTTP